jgi:hypothetical protein
MAQLNKLSSALQACVDFVDKSATDISVAFQYEKFATMMAALAKFVRFYSFNFDSRQF